MRYRKMYTVIFNDSVHGMEVQYFEDFDSAAEYWNEYADTPTCTAGSLTDLETGEVIWQFSEEK